MSSGASTGSCLSPPETAPSPFTAGSASDSATSSCLSAVVDGVLSSEVPAPWSSVAASDVPSMTFTTEVMVPFDAAGASFGDDGREDDAGETEVD